MRTFVFLRRACAYLRPYRTWAILILLGLLLESGFTGSVPIGFKFLIDRAIAPRDQQILVLVLGLLGGGVVLVSLAGLGRDYLYARLCAALLNDLRQRMFDHLQRLSMGFYSRMEVGDVVARFSIDLASVEIAITAAIPWAILPAIEVALSTLLLFALEWRLALVAMCVFPLSLIGPKLFAPRASTASYGRKQYESSVLAAVHENVGAQAVIKAFGLEPQVISSFRDRLSNLVRMSVQVGFLSALVERSAGTTVFVLQILVMGVGAYMTFRDILSIGSLVSFQSLFLTLSWSLSYVTQYVPTLVQAVAGVQRIDELLHEEAQIADAPGAVPLQRLAQEITFEDVQFSYTGQELTLNKASFSIRAGESVAFVGSSGSGKSTILNLLARFYDPQAGQITIDGRDLREVTQNSLRAQMGMVFQESFLFNTTIRENIRMGKPDATDAEVETAARAAEIHTVVESLPQGYNTVVGERGGRLSGGQRQRVAIARALLRNPAILLLDEATSALDAETEAAINATLEHVSQGRTVIAVTHRLSSAMYADRIFVLDHGHIVEQGRHEELVALGGAYAQLWHKQHGLVVSEEAEEEATRWCIKLLLATQGEPSVPEVYKQMADKLSRQLAAFSLSPEPSSSAADHTLRPNRDLSL